MNRQKKKIVKIKQPVKGDLKIGVLKNFAIFTGSHLGCSLFLIKFQVFRLQYICLKRLQHRWLWLWRNFTEQVFLIEYLLLKFTVTMLARKNCVLLNLILERLLGCFWPFHMFTQSIKFFFTFHYDTLKNTDVWKDVILQIDSKNEWLLHSAGFAAKSDLVFVLTLENAFS